MLGSHFYCLPLSDPLISLQEVMSKSQSAAIAWSIPLRSPTHPLTYHSQGTTHWRLSLKIICPASSQLQELNLLQKSKVVNATNSALLTCNPGEATSYQTIDIVVEEDCAKQFPVTLQLPSIPPHKLDLKVGVPLNASADFWIATTL